MTEKRQRASSPVQDAFRVRLARLFKLVRFRKGEVALQKN